MLDPLTNLIARIDELVCSVSQLIPDDQQAKLDLMLSRVNVSKPLRRSFRDWFTVLDHLPAMARLFNDSASFIPSRTAEQTPFGHAAQAATLALKVWELSSSAPDNITDLIARADAVGLRNSRIHRIEHADKSLRDDLKRLRIEYQKASRRKKEPIPKDVLVSLKAQIDEIELFLRPENLALRCDAFLALEPESIQTQSELEELIVAIDGELSPRHRESQYGDNSHERLALTQLRNEADRIVKEVAIGSTKLKPNSGKPEREHIFVLDGYRWLDKCRDPENLNRLPGFVLESILMALESFREVVVQQQSRLAAQPATHLKLHKQTQFVPTGVGSEADATPTPNEQTPQERRMLWLARAMFLVREHPDWTDARIAREVGVNPAQLTKTRCPEYQAAAKLFRDGTPKRGHVRLDRDSGTSDIEAYDFDDPAERDWD